MDKQFERPGFYFQWHFLEACNLKCRHCYQNGVSLCHSDKTLVDMTITQITKCLNAWNIIGRVSITGGEPFLEPEVLSGILSRLEGIEKLQHIGILTNGTLIDSNRIKFLQTISKLREVQISFDGSTADLHDKTRGIGSFKRAQRGLRLLTESGIPTAIMFTATRINKTDISSIIDFAVTEHVAAITIERYTPVLGHADPLALRSEEVHAIFERILQQKRTLEQKKIPLKIRTSRPLWNLLDKQLGGVCPVGYSCLTIMHDGTLYPCRRLPISLGTIQRDGIFKVWYTSPVLRRLRKRQEIDACAGCEHERFCDGCRAAAYAVNHDYMGRDPMCWKGKDT